MGSTVQTGIDGIQSDEIIMNIIKYVFKLVINLSGLRRNNPAQSHSY